MGPIHASNSPCLSLSKACGGAFPNSVEVFQDGRFPMGCPDFQAVVNIPRVFGTLDSARSVWADAHRRKAYAVGIWDEAARHLLER